MDRIAQIIKNSASLNALNRQINEILKLRDRSPEGKELWSTACKRFREAFDDLFFPGGVAILLKVGAFDSSAIQAAIDFLVADPVHFRSGYIKEDLWRKVPKWTLSDNDRDRIEKAALSYLDKQIRRDFWYMCRAMARIGTPSFWQQVEQRLCSENALIVKRASYLFAYSQGLNPGEQLRRQVHYEVLRKKYGEN